jgi:hypothetical protein
MKQIALIILFLLLYSLSDAQRTIAPNDPVYFRKSYILPKEKFYLLSVKRATAHYYQFYNEVAKEKKAKEISMIEIYPDSLVTDTNQLINLLHIETYHKGFLTEEFRIKYLREGKTPVLNYDTLEWKQYSYENRNRTVGVRNKRYGSADNYADSLRTFYFNRKKRLIRTIAKNDAVKQTDTRFVYNRSGDLTRVSSVLLYSLTEMPVTEKKWELSYENHIDGVALAQKVLDSVKKIPTLDFIGQELSGPPDKARKIVVHSFEKSPQEQEFKRTGSDSLIINQKGDYSFVFSVDQNDTSVQIKKIKGSLAVHRTYLELSLGDDKKRSFKYTTRQIIGGDIYYENNFRGKTVSGSCSLDIEKTVITDTEDGTVEFYRIKR